MTDQELLETAAKAAGYTVARQSDDGLSLLLEGVQDAWNPLRDDGDALRLAVNLEIDVYQFNGWVEAWTLPIQPIREYQANDAYAATRRVIVRAAAAIGQQKE